ncbi:head maturation protease, ClpP-related [Companilactobacillus muriivasis]|uniref:head maturation protease, ClpP-related n=1 Tax=Companilactobacillus muriivasis TaxID=3081444 RepID=UPI0030C7555F
MPQQKKPKFWEMTQTSNDSADVNIDGEIVSQKWDDSDTTGASFRDDLKQLGDVKTINLHINSPGGSVFEGISIYNQLKQNKATVNVYVDGLAASIASVIAMSGDTIFMPENSMMMIHNPMTFVAGNAEQLRKQADDLDRVRETSVATYLAKSNGKITENDLKKLMDDETWLSADEAVNYGLADEVLEANKAVACVVPDKFKNMFQHLPSQIVKEESKQVSESRLKLIEKAKQNNEKIKQTLGGTN